VATSREPTQHLRSGIVQASSLSSSSPPSCATEAAITGQIRRDDDEEEEEGGMTGGAAASQAYGEAWYWDERYRKEAGPFDWYQKYPALAPLLRLYVQPHHRLLLVGCGNSGESGAWAHAWVIGMAASPEGRESLAGGVGERVDGGSVCAIRRWNLLFRSTWWPM
jgi:hypothetical protein